MQEQKPKKWSPQVHGFDARAILTGQLYQRYLSAPAGSRLVTMDLASNYNSCQNTFAIVQVSLHTKFIDFV